MMCCDVNVSYTFHVSPTARSLVGFDVSKGEQRVGVRWGGKFTAIGMSHSAERKCQWETEGRRKGDGCQK